MTVGISATNLANPWLSVMRGAGNGVTFTAPATLFVQLHTGDPGANGTANVSVGSTTRVAVGQGAPSGGSQAISGTNPSWTNGGTSETISHISIWSASTAGTFYYSVALTTPAAWVSTNTLTLTTLTLAMTPIAA